MIKGKVRHTFAYQGEVREYVSMKAANSVEGVAPVGSSEHLTSRKSGQDVLRRNPSGNQFFRARHGSFRIHSYGVQSVGSIDLDELDNATGVRDLRSSSAVILFFIRTPSSPASLSTYVPYENERNSPIFP